MAVPALAVEPAARILVVEDEGLIARDICRTLEKLGYVVAGCAESAATALKIASQTEADLILMDIRLRGPMDGIQLAEELKKKLEIPVVYLTAHTDTETMERAKLTEPFGYVVKPFSGGDIRAAVEIALQRHALARQIGTEQSWITALLRSIGDAVVIAGRDSRVVFLNKAAENLIGISAANASGQLLDSILIVRPDLSSPAGSSRQSERRSTPAPFSLATLVRFDGTERLVVRALIPARPDQSLSSPADIIVLRDVTDFKKTEMALRETNWFLTRSLERVRQSPRSRRNDPRLPRESITAAPERLGLRYSASLGHPEEEYLNWIGNGCARMAAMLSALLDYHQAPALGPVDAAPTSASAALDEAVGNLRSVIQDAGTSVERQGLPDVVCHPVALLWLFQNLLEDVISRGSADGGNGVPRVEVSAQLDGDSWLFRVGGNGDGRSSLVPEHSFQLFGSAREGEPTARIALATCRRLVERNGGTIWTESGAGRESGVCFTLPAVSAVNLTLQ